MSNMTSESEYFYAAVTDDGEGGEYIDLETAASCYDDSFAKWEAHTAYPFNRGPHTNCCGWKFKRIDKFNFTLAN